MTKFQAAYLETLKSPLKLTSLSVAGPLGPGQVLVKLLAIGICGSQILEIKGEKGNAKFLPHMLGHEGVGRVVSTGPLVSKVKIDDRVVLHWRKGSGIDAKGAQYIADDGTAVGSGPISVFSEMAVVSENRMTVIADDVPDEISALLGCSLSTGLGAIDNEIEFKLGSSLLVFGAGAVGLSAAIGARLKGAGQIAVADQNPLRRESVELLGATFVDSNNEGWKDHCQRLSPHGYDVIVEATGSEKFREAASLFSAPGGHVLFLGQGHSTDQISIGTQDNAFGADGVRMIFSQGGGFSPNRDLARFARAASAHREYLNAICTVHSGGLEDINDLIHKFSSGQILRPILLLK